MWECRRNYISSWLCVCVCVHSFHSQLQWQQRHLVPNQQSTVKFFYCPVLMCFTLNMSYVSFCFCFIIYVMQLLYFVLHIFFFRFSCFIIISTQTNPVQSYFSELKEFKKINLDVKPHLNKLKLKRKIKIKVKKRLNFIMNLQETFSLCTFTLRSVL